MAFPYSISWGPFPGRVTGREKGLYNTTTKVAGIYWGNKGKPLLIYEQKESKHVVLSYDRKLKRRCHHSKLMTLSMISPGIQMDGVLHILIYLKKEKRALVSI